MSILTFEKPKRLRPAAEHNQEYQSDTDIAGTYVQNMAREDQLRWKAKFIKTGEDPRVEIRKTTSIGHAQVLLVVRYKGPGLHVTMSANNKMIWAGGDWTDLERAVKEAYHMLVEARTCYQE